MLRFGFNLISFFLMIYSSGVMAQTAPELVLPNSLHGSIKLEIGASSKAYHEALDYEALAVYVKNAVDEYSSNPIQGRHIREENYLVFTPYFPFEHGIDYVARTKSPSDYFFESFQIGEQKKAEEAGVISIYPSTNQLPANLLRFYIYFNTPMKKGQATQHIQLVDTAGNIDNHTFMEFKQELWSADGKRLTILFDPGRIKRGVSTNMKQGSALLEGEQYTLCISGVWQDVYGQTLSAKTTKEFEVVSAYRDHISARNWVVNKPKANSHDTLTICFDRILDHALIQSMIKLSDGENNFMVGHWEILENERLIQFIPENRWRKGNYQIVIDSRLEDIAGNNLQNLLDHIKTSEENVSKTHQYIHLDL